MGIRTEMKMQMIFLDNTSLKTRVFLTTTDRGSKYGSYEAVGIVAFILNQNAMRLPLERRGNRGQEMGQNRYVYTLLEVKYICFGGKSIYTLGRKVCYFYGVVDIYFWGKSDVLFTQK